MRVSHGRALIYKWKIQQKYKSRTFILLRKVCCEREREDLLSLDFIHCTLVTLVYTYMDW